MSKKDQAARIAERARETVNDGEPVWSRETIAKDIRRAITAAVRKERERCVQCVKWWKNEEYARTKPANVICDEIIDSINTKHNKRKGKR